MKSERARLIEAYFAMAMMANYRPEAPGDGCGGIDLSDEQLKNPNVLYSEASRYAVDFIHHEDEGGKFDIGVSHYETNRALIFCIEACRLLCAAQTELAKKLIGMAALELEDKL
jgi:hypothetical protein